jgi:signal transduction protein with GAF and PtsI domain
VNDAGPPDRRIADALLAAVARRLAAHEAIGPPAHDSLLDALAGAAVMVLEAQAASIAILDPGTDRLVFVAAAGPAAGEVVGLTIDANAGIAGYAFSTGQPLAIADAANDPRFDRSVAEATGYVPSTLLAVPLADADGTVGVLEALDRRGGTFTLRDLDAAAALARAATIAVRVGQGRRDAAALLQGAVTTLLDGDRDGPAVDDGSIEESVRRVTADLAARDDDPTWRLADRIARLRDVDPDAVELAIEWLDALLRRAGAEPGRSQRR